MENISINFKVEGVDGAVTSIDNLSNSTKQLDSSVSKNTKSVQTYSQQIKALQKELIALGGRTKENAAEFDALSDRIRELDDAREDLTIGTAKLDDALGNLPGPIGNAANSFKTFDLAVKNGRSALIQITKQFPLLKNAFVASGVGLIVVLFGALAAGVIKAFNSFAPLQKAVGNLGIAFNLVGKLLDPLVEMIGKGLTVAINGAARAIAFLTGNLDEYEKEVKAAEATKALEANLKYEASLYDLQKDKFNSYVQAQKEAEQELYEARKQINEEYADDIETRNKLLLEAEERYGRRIGDLDIKRRQSINDTIKGLEVQINKVQLLEQKLRKQFEAENALIQARTVGDLQSTGLLEKLKEALDIASKAIDNTKTKTDQFKKELSILNIQMSGSDSIVLSLVNKYKELETQMTSVNSNTEEQQKKTKELRGEIARLTSLLKFLGGKDGATAEVVKSLQTYDRNLQSIIETLKDSGVTYEQISSTITKLEQARRGSSLEEERKYQDEYNKLEETYFKNRIKNVEDYTNVRIKAIQNEAKIDLEYVNTRVKNGEITDLQAQQEIDNIKTRSKESIDLLLTRKKVEEDTAKAGFQALTENIKNNNAFGESVRNVRNEITKYDQELRKAIQSGALDAFVLQNIEALKALAGKDFQLTGDTFIDKPAFDEMFNNLANQFEALGSVSQATRDKIFLSLRKDFQAIQNEIELTNVGFNTSQFDLQMAAIERQKAIDMERLRLAGATKEQLLELERNYAKQVNLIEYQMLMNNADMFAQSIGLFAAAIGEENDMFKGLKFAEASINAITSSIKAYETGIEFGGPAGPVIAPILAAATFAAQMAAAKRILQVEAPDTTTSTSAGLGANPTYQGYYEMGGMVYGRRHAQGGVMAEMEGGEYVINRRSMMIPGVSEMAATLNNLNNIVSNPALLQSAPQVVKAYVVSKEMTKQQSADKRIKDLSRL